MKKLLLSLWLLITSPILRFFRNEYKRYKGRPEALRKAIKRADKKHLKTGKHYKIYFLDNRYQILTRQDVQRKIHEKEFLSYINCTKLNAIAFYETITGQPSEFAKELLKL